MIPALMALDMLTEDARRGRRMVRIRGRRRFPPRRRR
jgi:hypothetical protein